MTVQLQFLCHQPDTSESPVIVITNKTSKSSTRFSIYPHKIASFPKNGKLAMTEYSSLRTKGSGMKQTHYTITAYPPKIASFPKNGNLQLQSFSVQKLCLEPQVLKLN